MANYICIDGGTTNTRLSLASDGRVVDIVKYSVGAGSSIENKDILKNTVKNGINELLCRNSLKAADIKRILASGMITSEFGLLELPHTTTPVGLEELNTCKCETVLSDISEIPFVFMRGVKTACDVLGNADIMRGEETEVFGILNGDGIYVLPGSHSKVITIENGKITDFCTLFTGEMVAALSGHTILKSSVELKDNEICKDFLLKGYGYCSEHGINEALFKTRVLKNTFKKNRSEVYSFFLGVVLCGEVGYILKKNPQKVTVAGNKALKEPTALLLSELCEAEIVTVPEDEVATSTALGMIRIFEYK